MIREGDFSQKCNAAKFTNECVDDILRAQSAYSQPFQTAVSDLAIALPEGVSPTITDRDFTVATLQSPGGGVKNEDEDGEEGAEEGEESAAESGAE